MPPPERARPTRPCPTDGSRPAAGPARPRTCLRRRTSSSSAGKTSVENWEVEPCDAMAKGEDARASGTMLYSGARFLARENCPSPSTPAGGMIGQKIAHYHILKKIGEGGM